MDRRVLSFLLVAVVVLQMCFYSIYQWKKISETEKPNIEEIVVQEPTELPQDNEMKQDPSDVIPTEIQQVSSQAFNDVFRDVRFEDLSTSDHLTYEELLDRLPKSTRIPQVCGLPNYQRAFLLDDNSLSFVDAVVRSKQPMENNYEEELVIMTYVPNTLWNKNTEYRHTFGEIDVDVFVEGDSRGRVLINLDSSVCYATRNYKAQYITTFHCGVSREQSEVIRRCGESERRVKLNLFEQTASSGRKSLLTEPIGVQDCRYSPEMEVPSTEQGMKIAFCSMVLHSRSTAQFIVEWLEYHFLVGFDVAILYIHLGPSNERFSPDLLTILSSYADSGKVILIPWNFTKPQRFRQDNWSPKAGDQRAAFTDALHRFGVRFHWIAFIDNDEYIVVPDEQRKRGRETVGDVLWAEKRLADVENLLMNSFVYSWRRASGESELVFEIYPYFDEKLRAYRKSLVQTKYCLHVNNHECNLNIFGKYRETCGGKCINSWKGGCEFLSDDVLHIAHFYYKKYHSYNEIVQDENGIKKEIAIDSKTLNDLKFVVEKKKKELDWKRFDFIFVELLTDPNFVVKYPDTSKNRFLN